jgi:RsiW-degrading membrane proteinase PrsW (M82 family)
VTTADHHLLIPPREEEEIYPFRRVWRSIALESGLFFLLAVVLYLLVGMLGLRLPKSLFRPTGLALAITPAGLWVMFSLLPERRVPQPRKRLLTVALISALAANAIGVPLVEEYLKVNAWLPLSSAITRIIGFTCTVGIVQEMLKYLVVRYVAWPDEFRVRLDGVAYGAASAVGYMTVLNLHFVFTGSPPPDTVAIQVFSNVALHVVGSVFVGYGLGQVRFGRPAPLLLPMTLILGALVAGVAIPIRAGLVNAGLGLEASYAKPLLGLIFSAALLTGLLLVQAFLFNSAERQSGDVTFEEMG